MRILSLLLLLAYVAGEVAARSQDDEPRALPNRGLLKRGLLAKGKQTTTTTTAAPEEEVEYEDEEFAEEGQEPSTEAPVSSTEGKKLVAGGVRPFRSNTDLLEALKRRRAQAAEAKLHGHSNTPAPAPAREEKEPTEAPVKASFNKKRFNAPTRESVSEDAPAPAKPSRARFGRPAPKAVQEPEPEEQNESSAPVRTGRTFLRRGGN